MYALNALEHFEKSKLYFLTNSVRMLSISAFHARPVGWAFSRNDAEIGYGSANGELLNKSSMLGDVALRNVSFGKYITRHITFPICFLDQEPSYDSWYISNVMGALALAYIQQYETVNTREACMVCIDPWSPHDYELFCPVLGLLVEQQQTRTTGLRRVIRKYDKNSAQFLQYTFEKPLAIRYISR